MSEGHVASPLNDTGSSLPLVSIIIRSMGRPTLRQAMNSVAEQSYPHLELVVVNAKGQGHPVLSDHHGHVPLRFCSDDQPLPRSRAANRGMEQAQGYYLLFLDDDDWLLPEHVSALVAALQRQPHSRVAYAGVECVREDLTGGRLTVLVYNQPFDPLRLLYENYIPMHAVLFERQLFVAGCRFDETLDIYEDWDFWLQLRALGPFIHVDQVSAVYRINAMENLGSAAQQGLQIPAWDTLIHKWRDHWSDHELRTICAQAKLWQQKHQQSEYYRQQAEYARADYDVLATTLEQERQARQDAIVLLEQEQARHQDLISVFQQRIAALVERITHQQRELDTVAIRLAAIESSNIWRASYPYRWLRIGLRAWWQRGRAPERSIAPAWTSPNHPVPCSPPRQPVDVIIPVYRGLAETRACLDSVLATVPPHLGEVIVIEDASPEPELVAWLESLAAQHPRITLLRNPENLGFVQTCNRGMALHPERDVVLLNSDTEVANDWLARLQACAYRDRRIGTVTPFSNNATICSYPRFCADNPLPSPWSVTELDALFNQCNPGQWTEIPTAVGFCMYIRRDCLIATGLFDERHFGKGYGEENDFSLRARALGWRHALCADVFVYHAGSVSFADHQNHKKRHAMTVLNRLYPDYESLVHRHIAQDPARPLRARVDLARLTRSRLPKVLFVAHDRGGGTMRHIEDLAELFADRLQLLLLRPDGNSQYLLSWLRSTESLQLMFRLPDDADALLECLRTLAVRRVHFHHTLGLHPLLLNLPARLDTPYEFTVHDYYACCPQITLTDYQNRYCGEPDEAGCNRCLTILPTPDGDTIQTWRQRHQSFVTQAERVLAPSQDVARRFARYFPTARIQWAPHPDLDAQACPAPQPEPLSPDAPLRIVVLGALSEIKGADVLEQCALDAGQRSLPLAFQLVGYAYRDPHRPPRDVLRIHGPYDDAELPNLLTEAQPHVVWFPALWPETYSYTLSACLRLGLPVVVPDLGAFPERVAGRSWSWVRPWRQSARNWNDFFTQIRVQHFIPNYPPPPADGQVEPPSFDYWRDYWVDDDLVVSASDEATVDATLAMIAADFVYPRLTGVARHQAALRQRLLDWAVRLRHAPKLRWVVRQIPFDWQVRLKAWLRGSV